MAIPGSGLARMCVAVGILLQTLTYCTAPSQAPSSPTAQIQQFQGETTEGTPAGLRAGTIVPVPTKTHTVIPVSTATREGVPTAVSPPPRPSPSETPTELPFPSQMEFQMIDQIGGQTEVIAVEGNLAFLGVGPRMVIFDVSDPYHPKPVGRTEVLGDWWVSGIAIKGDTALVALIDMFYVLDVTDPSTPKSLAEIPWRSGILRMVDFGDTLILVNGTGRFTVFDVSDPKHPIQVAWEDSWGMPQAQVIEGKNLYSVESMAGHKAFRIYRLDDQLNLENVGRIEFPETGMDLAVDGNTVFVAVPGDLYAVDVSNPAEPQATQVFKMPENNTIKSITMTPAGLFVLTNSGYYVLDVSNPVQPKQVFASDKPGSGGRDLAVDGDMIYLAMYNGGIKVIDLSGGMRPTETGIFQLAAGAYGVMVEKNLIFVTDVTHLHIFSESTNQELQEIGTFALDKAIIEMTLVGDVVYLLTSDGVHAVDVSIPTEPREIQHLKVSDEAAGVRACPPDPTTGEIRHVTDSAMAEAMAANNNLVCMGDRSNSVRCFDVSDLSCPKESAVLSVPEMLLDMAMEKTTLYVATAAGLHSIDVSDLAAPREINFFSDLGRMEGVWVETGMLYATTLADDSASEALHILDVSNPMAPRVVSSLNDLPGASSVFDLVRRNNLLCLSTYEGGLMVFDVSRPGTWLQVGSFRDLGDTYMYDLAISDDRVYLGTGYLGLVLLSMEQDEP